MGKKYQRSNQLKKIREGELTVAKARQMAAQNGFAFEANSPEELKQGLMLMKRQLRDMEAHRDQYELALRNGFVIAGFGGNLQGIDVPETLITGKVPAGMTPEQALNEVIDFMRETIKKATKDLLASSTNSASPKSSVKYIETKKKRNAVRESIDWMEWWKRKNLPPEVHQLHYWKMAYQERSQDHWDAEEWDISKEEDIKEHFITLVLKYHAHKIKNEIEEMFEVAEKLYKSFTDTEFFIKEFDIDYSEKYKDICKKATQLGSVEYLESIKDDWAHIEKDYFKGCFDLTYDEFVSETLPEIEELLSKGKAELSEARMRNPGRKDQISPTFIIQQTSIFFEDEGFYKVDYRAQPSPRTFRISEDHSGIGLSINIAINGDYEDDILINAFFDSRCGSGYVIQAQTLEGAIEWAGFDKSEFKEDLEDAWLTANKFFEANKDKHTLEMWLIREFGQDKAHDTLEKLYQQGQEETFTKLLSREEFDAYKSSLTEKTGSAIKENKGLKEGRLDHIKAKWQSELNKGVEPKTLMDPWAVCEGMKWLGKDGWIRVEEILIPTEYEEPYPDFYMEIFDQHTCKISHDIYTINEINSYVRETKARLVNNGIKNLAERVLDYDAYDRYYDEGAEAYFEGKTLSDVPITGNAWFREAWEEGWKNAKACDEEEYEAEYEDDFEFFE